jgi:hypothetical protein
VVYEQLSELAQSSSGLNEITKLFNICTPLTSKDVEHLILWVENAFTMMTMCDYPYPSSECFFLLFPHTNSILFGLQVANILLITALLLEVFSSIILFDPSAAFLAPLPAWPVTAACQ